MAVAYVPDFSQASFTCIVAPDGECTDHLRLPNLLRRKNSFRPEDKLLKVFITLMFISLYIYFIISSNSRISVIRKPI
jgi:hypothetical protein